MKFNYIALCLLIALSSFNCAEIVVFGDSWGTYGEEVFAEVMGNYGLSVDNVAISGTTAADWAKDKYDMANAVRKNADCKYVWLTIGGNDAIPNMIADVPFNETTSDLLADTKVFLDVLFDEFPNIKLV